MVKVALVPCDSYENASAAVETAVDLCGGLAALGEKSDKLLLKPNLLTKSYPDDACTTHPAVFAAVAELLQKNGWNNLSWGDSPGHGDPRAIARTCGIADVCDRLGIPFADFLSGKETDYPEGKTCKRFIFASGALEADGIVNICKMKTHMLERITGAQKNSFGLVYGFNKGATHVKYPNAAAFAGLLADLNLFMRPRLHIMDGVYAMEGNGPQSGTPKKMGVILASTDPVALDTLFASLVYLDPTLVPTNVIGAEYGVGVCDPSQIEVVTPDGVLTVEEAQKAYGDKDFDVYRGREDKGEISFLRPFRKLIEPKPMIDKTQCVQCGICVKSCPVEGGALHFKKEGKPPVYDYKKCIKCYCCQEMCPKKAIFKYRHPLTKLADHKFGR